MRTRSRRSARRSSSSSRERTCASRWARLRRESRESEHDLGRVAELYVAALEEAAGGEVVGRRRAAGGESGRGGCRDLSGGRGSGGDRQASRRGRAWQVARGQTPTSSGAYRRGHGWSRSWPRSFAVRAWLARGMVGPFIMVDELIYSELGRSLADGGELLVRDVPSSGYGFVYPALISPAYAVFERSDRRLRRGEDVERARHVPGRGPRLPARPPRRRVEDSRCSLRCSPSRFPRSSTRARS